MKRTATKIATVMLALISILSIALFAGCGSPELIDVQMMMPPDKVEYVIGEKFDKTGMVITAVYSDGTRKEITDYTIDKTGALTKDDKVITITYGEYRFEQPINVIAAGDKIIITLANGVDRCELYADGTIALGGGGGSMRKPNVAHWSWDPSKPEKERLEIWIPIVDGGVTAEEPTKMTLEYDEQNSIQFAYMLAGRWQMHYFIQYKEWSKALTADVTYPLA